MGRFSAELALAWAAASLLLVADASSSSDAQPAFIRSLSSYNYMKFERCVRVKIPENNDDDGNSYFYNGAYRSQSLPYVAYRMCSDCSLKDCDDSSFLAPLANVVDNQVAYTQGYCNSCSAQCRRRRVEEDDEGEGEGDNNNNNNNNNNYANANLQVNCNSCVSECSSMLQNYYEGNDETAYLGCNAAYADENGLQYYSMASCGEDGGLRIGLFYDDECTVKKDDVTGYGENFAYDTFLATQNICMSCADGICDDMEQSLECLDGKNQNYNVDDEMYACKAYKKAAKEWTYAKARGDKKVGLIVLSLLLIGLFLMGAYTYFVRHKRQEEKDKAATMAAAEPKAAEYAVMT